MIVANRFPLEDLPDLPHARQMKAGFPWLTFDGGLEREFRQANLDENLRHIRFNMGLALITTLVFLSVGPMVPSPALHSLTGPIHVLTVVPLLMCCLAASLSHHRHGLYAPLAAAGAASVGFFAVAIQLVASSGGVAMLFPYLILTSIFMYFMAGLLFYHALGINALVTLVYVGGPSLLGLPDHEFGYGAMFLLAVNLFCASVAYMHEKSSRSRFLEAALLRELVARDGLTGIRNRRMFDQHIHRTWQQAVRDTECIAVLLVDIDCFKDYNDRYGHQAGDECLRAVALCLNQCARRPLDFVARYGGEEFAVVLYEASREYVSELLTRIQRSIEELNIPHEASRVASRLTVSIGAACIAPSANRSHEGLIQLADEALYAAKEQGRNCVVVMEGEYQTLRTGRFERRRG